MSRETIFAEVLAERERQDAMFGGHAHDDTHSATDWGAIFIRHLGLAFDDGKPADVCLMNDHCAGHDPVRYRRQMVRLAAIAVAALETFDRKSAQAAPAVPPSRLSPHQLDWGRRVAADLGEEILLLDRRQDVMRRVEEVGLHAVGVSQADAWQHANALARVEPPAAESPS